jgi:hypothetical protein
MINLIEGYINLSKRNICAGSNSRELNSLAEEGLIEKLKNGRGETYYRFESTENGMRFGVFIRLREKKRIQWLVLHWLDGPCTSKGWDDVSEAALKEEYRLLLKFVGEMIGGPPDNKKDRRHTWNLHWGQVEVSYEPRDFVAAVFMKPRQVTQA